MDEDENSNGVSVDDVERIADELVHDFEGACLLIANELTSSSDPALLLEILISVGQSQEREEQENGEETHRRWLPEDVFDRFEADFLPQAVQLVLGKPFDRECVECVNRFLQFVLGRVKIRLSQGDPCLLPTLIRILDDQRQFYVYHGSFDKDERDDNKDEGMNDGAAAESETVQFVMELVLVKVLQIQQQTTQRNQGNEDMPEVEGEEDAEETDLSESGSDQFGRSVQLLRLDIYLRHFRSSSLEKRIYGLTEIVAAITRQFNGQVREQHDPTPSTLLRKLDYLVFWMHDNRLIEDLFGEKLHAELIKRTVSLFQFMSELECLLPESLDIVLSCYRGSSSISQNVNQVPTQQCHEAQRTTVQAILEALVDFVDDRLLRHLFCHLQSARVVDANRLALLAAIAARNELSDRYTGGGESRLRDQVVIHMWDVVRSGIVSEELAGQTLQRLEDILRKDISEWNEEVDEDLPSGLSKAYQLTSVSLKFLAQLALMVSDLKVQLPNLNCPEKKSLVDVLTDELAEHKNKAWNNIQKDHPEVPAGDLLDYSPTQQDTAELVSDPASHANEVKVRLLALRAAWIIEDQQAPSSRSCPSVSLLQLDLVWHLLIKTACTTDEASLCFQWIEFCLNTSRALSEEDDPDRRSSLLSMESVKHLLFNNFSTLSGSRVTLLTLCCFQSLFRHVNLLAGGLQSFAASREDDPSGCLPADGGEIVDLATDQPLIGLEQLWHLAIRSVNSTVAEECITLLTSFYLEIVPSLRCTGIFLQKKLEFVETCMGFLTSAKSKAEKLQRQRPNDQGTITEEADENVAIVNRCVDLLRYFLDACDGTTEDESGSGAFDDPHGAHLHSSGELTSKRKVFQLENLEERLQYLDIYPSPMKEMPSSNAVAGSGLSETGLLSVSRRPSWTFRQQHALLGAIPDEGECDDSDQNDERNHDLLLSEIPAHIESSELAEFSSPPRWKLPVADAVRNPSMKSPTTRVRPTLHLPQDVSPQRGPDLTLEDVSKALEEVSTDGEQVLTSQILANEGVYFDTLLQLVDWSDATSQRTWELICRLPTNNELLRKMIRLRPSALGANEDVELLQDTENEIDCAGLVNPGCICYMNALVQQLFMTPSFREGLLSVDCMSEATGSSPWADEVTELQRLFVSLALTHFKSFDPTQFALSHQDLDGNPTNLRVQMDADEFFCLLLDRIDTSLRAATPPESDALSERDVQSVNFLDKCFGGVLVNQIITQQGYVSEREERFFALSLEVSKKQHLKECLSLYVQGESLDGENAYFCERLQQKVSETKRICIKKLPQTLVFHLKRFEFDFDTMEKLKINDYLEFPQEIDMLPYTSEGLASSFPDSPRQRECNEPIDDALKGQPSTMYDLVGIVVHSGTSDMGHYYSFIKDRRRPERWLEFNDEVVREFDIERMDEECFGGEEAKPHWDGTSRVSKVQMERRNAYMLLYERRDDVSVSSENKGNAEKILQSEGVWQNPSTASDSLQALSRQLSQQNIQFQEIVDAFDPHYGDFIEALANLGLEYTSSEVEGEPGRAVGDFHDWDGNIAMLPHRMTNLGISVLGSQYLFGIAPLLPTTCDQSSFQLQGRLVERILTWLSAENPETNADASEQFLFSSWLLRQVVASPPSGKPSESAGLQEIRTWFFDIMFLSENNPELVDGCVSILSMSVSILTRQIVSVLDHLELNDLDENEPAYVVLTSFYRAALILFNDREQEIELTDSTTGGVFILPSSTIITAQTRIGTFLENCVCHAFEDHSKEREVTRQMFAAKVQYLDRFLFALQGELPSRKSSGSTHSTFSASSLNASPSRLLEALGVDRIRSCTFTQERSILKELLQRTQSSDKCSSQSSQAKELESLFDISLLMSQVALTNILRYSFEDMLAPAIVAAIHRGSHSQRDKLLSLLIAVLEDVKATQLEKLLRVFDFLLDSEENEVHSASDLSAFVDRAPIHKHLFSPTRGILEAAAYYKDHRTLHKYSFLLLEFTVNRTKDSPFLQHLFKHDVEIGEQAGWITNWLASYLDPSGSIRRNESADNTGDEIQLAQDVRTLFEAIEQSFGCVLFPTSKKSDAAASHSSSASLAEEVRESKRSANTANQDDEVDATIASLQDIATEFEDAHNPKRPGQAAPIKSPYGLILQEATPEIEIDDSDEHCRMHLNGKDDDDGVAVNFSHTKNAPSLSSLYGHHELYNNRSEA
ncbi:Ubiquitin-specific protease, partial [Globisporangium splendens]